MPLTLALDLEGTLISNAMSCIVLFVGDTDDADFAGPRAFGMRALHLVRGARTRAPHQIGSLEDVLDAVEGP